MTDYLIDHKYTLLEIERVREATSKLLARPEIATAYHFRDGERPKQRPTVYFINAPDKTVELHLRTYLMSGIRPEEIEERAQERQRTAREMLERRIRQSEELNDQRTA